MGRYALLGSLLANRLKLTVHQESLIMPVSELLVGKGWAEDEGGLPFKVHRRDFTITPVSSRAFHNAQTGLSSL
jgi:hypothetical protein